MTLLPGPTGLAEIRDDILTDITLEASAAGRVESVAPGSENHVWATGMAAPCALIHARISSGDDAITPLNARGEDLLRWKRAMRLPDVPASAASGKLVLEVAGTATIPDGQVFTVEGLRGRVVGTWEGVVDGDEVDVTLDVAGKRGNKPPGTEVSFSNPPTNVSQVAEVSTEKPLTGGFDEETEERLRERVLNRFSNIPGGGNWGLLRELAFNASPAVQQSFVYPALGGPSTTKVVVLKGFDRENHDYTRTLSTTVISLVGDATHAALSAGVTATNDTAAGEATNVAILLTIPDSVQSGGGGDGWSDIAPWPQLVSQTYVQVSSITAAGVITCNADTTTDPVNGQTRVAWWSPNDMRFHVRTVTGHAGSSGAWVLTFDAPFVDTRGLTPLAGEYLSPAAEHLAEYGATWVDLLEKLGPGENTADAQLLLNGRALRKPTFSRGGPRSGLTSFQLHQLQSTHPEIEDIAWSARSLSSPTVPGAVETAPNVLVPGNFGVYKQ